MNLEFSTGVHNAIEDDDEDYEPRTVELTLNDKKYTVYEPSSSLMSLSMAAAGSRDASEVAHALWEFLEVTLEPAAYRVLRTAAASRQGIDIGNLMGLMMDIIKEFSGFPTQPQSESAASRKPTGRPSTGRAPGPGSTRSNSARRAS